jgi:hypothetical protein
MRFHVGPIPEDFSPDESWRRLREPNLWLMQLLALPVGLVAMVLVAFCWQWILSAREVRITGSGTPEALMLEVVAVFVGVLVVHELLHGAVHPRLGFSKDTILGIWPRKGLFFAHYCGALTRDRFLAVFAAPLAGITLLPLLLVAAGLPLSPKATMILAYGSILNALFACGDMIGMILIAWQVPRRAEVRNRGWQTFWRPLVNSRPSATGEHETSDATIGGS